MFYFLDQSFWTNPWLIGLFLVSIFVVMVLRYFVSTWGYAKILSNKDPSDRNSVNENKKQIHREIKSSIVSSILFTFFVTASFWAYQRGYTELYTSFSEYPILYTVLSPLLLLVVYETYYYWLHRFMHLPVVFKHVHKIHHRSVHPTVYSSFAFHPLEAALQFVFFPVVIATIPLHYLAVLFVFIVMTVSAVINHSGVEVFKHKSLLHHVIGATHHEMHHQNLKRNFGLYFTWWDKWMKTEGTTTELTTRNNRGKNSD